MNIEKAKVHYINSNQNHVIRNKEIATITYDGLDISVLYEDIDKCADLLYKDVNGEYWIFYQVSAPFEMFQQLNDKSYSKDDEGDFILYCNHTVDKFKPIHDDIVSYMKSKIEKLQYFNIIELAYIEMYHPELYKDALESRETFIQKHREEREQRQKEEENNRKQKVKDKNEIFRDKVKNAKEAILSGKSVRLEILEYYKDDNYNNFTTQNIFLYLLKEYEINVPLKTQGFINNKLHSFNFENGDYRYFGKTISQTVSDYLLKLKEKIIEEKNHSLYMDNDLDITESLC